MKPAMNITYRRLAESDVSLLPEVVRVLDECLGKGDQGVSEMKSYLGEDSYRLIFAAFGGDTLVGVSTASSYLSPWVGEEITCQIMEDRIDLIPFHEHKVGLIESSAVRPEWRRRGISTKLTAMRLEFLVASGCTAALSLSWLSGQTDNSQNVLTRAGFTRHLDIPNWWEDEDGFCPTCRGVCHCTAAIFFRTL